MEETAKISQYYERNSLVDRLREALRTAGLGEGRIAPKDLAQIDQFHSRGLAATIELAQSLPLNAQTQVIDIGSGLGGPSRYLAQEYGCTVQGIDLSQSFVDAANFLAERTGLQEKVHYQQGNALSLPFDDGRFDVAWTQHVAMNIADRPGLYREAFRVLRSGGRFAIFDVLAGSGEALHFPVPWSPEPESSHLVTQDAMRDALSAQGFRVISWTDCTEAGIAWFLERERERAQSATPPILGQGFVMGPTFFTATGNLRRNLVEGRALLLQAICEKL